MTNQKKFTVHQLCLRQPETNPASATTDDVASLAERDLQTFAKFGIPSELLCQAGVRRIDDREARKLGIQLRDKPNADMAGIWFPYLDPFAGHRVTGRLRRDNPEVEQLTGGESRLRNKYLSPYGDSRSLYFPPRAKELLNDTAVGVIFCEAEKSVLALTSLAARSGRRWLALGSGGCWGWKGKNGIELDPNGQRETVKGALPSFDLVKWKDREVIIAFDSNATSNENVQAARRALAKELQTRGARVRIAEVPALPRVNGPDDMISERGDAAMLAVLDEAKTAAPESITPEQILALSGLNSLQPDADLTSIEEALCKLGPLLTNANRLTQVATRERAIRKLSELKIKAPGRWIDAALDCANGDEKEAGTAIIGEDSTPWDEEVDGASLLKSIEQALRRFVIFPPDGAAGIALWVAHTHVFNAATTTPYLAIESAEKRSGKTLLLEILTALVRRPLPASNITPAVVFRVIERVQPTLLLDEAETFLGEREELRGIINGGHRRAIAYVWRNVGDEHEPTRFSIWCPKAFAMIGVLPDTLQDRAIVIPMKRKAPGEHVERFRADRFEREADTLRRKLCRWGADNIQRLRDADPDVPPELNDRAADGWRPLLAIADAAGGEWPSKARRTAVRFSGPTAQEDESARTMLLADLRDLFASRGERLASSEIVRELAGMENRPWPEWRRGSPITTRQLAKLLRPFGIYSSQLWVNGKNQHGYEALDFADAFTRYLPAEDGGFHPLGTLEPSPVLAETHFSHPLGNGNPSVSKMAVSASKQSGLAYLADRKGGSAGHVAVEAPGKAVYNPLLPLFARDDGQPEPASRITEEL